MFFFNFGELFNPFIQELKKNMTFTTYTFCLLSTPIPRTAAKQQNTKKNRTFYNEFTKQIKTKVNTKLFEHSQNSLGTETQDSKRSVVLRKNSVCQPTVFTEIHAPSCEMSLFLFFSFECPWFKPVHVCHEFYICIKSAAGLPRRVPPRAGESPPPRVPEPPAPAAAGTGSPACRTRLRSLRPPPESRAAPATARYHHLCGWLIELEMHNLASSPK